MPSNYPDDLFTPTEGMNYGLEGYPDLNYGAGVLDREVLGNPRSPPNVPDGVVLAEDEEDGDSDAVTFGSLDLGNFMREASIQDLSWLDLAGQDPERLPKNPVDRAIPELEEAWGAHRQTNGIAFMPNVDRIAVPQSKSATDKEVSNLVRHAWRQVTAGVSFRDAATELAQRLGADAPRAKEAMQQVLDDSGLIGRVFVRAELYPNCASGRWSEQVQKQAAGARYIVSKKACEGCVLAQNGSCAVFRKELVSEVPWKQAAAKYRGSLEGSGRRLAADLTPKEALRHALAQTPQGMVQHEAHHPVQPVVGAGVSNQQAQAALDAASGKVQKASSVSAKEVRTRIAAWHKAGLLNDKDVQVLTAAKETPDVIMQAASRLALSPRGEVRGRVEGWRQAGLLAANDARRLLASTAPASEVMRIAVALVSRAAAYSGVENKGRNIESMTREAAMTALAQAEAAAARDAARLDQAVEGRRLASVRVKVAKISAAITQGLCGGPLRHLIRTTLASNEVALATPLLDPLLRRTGALADPKKKERAYQGATFERAAAVTSAGVGPAHGEVQRLIRWARQTFTEGVVGADFDQLLSARFSTSVVATGAAELRKLRARHEGLSGHVYVDARAYASTQGTAGCEKGGLKHRANAVPAVLEMSRCGSCARRSQREDGTSICQVYNKPLVASAPVENAKAYQAEMIRLANSGDEERTAALFANTFNASEFGLADPSALDDIVLDDMPSSDDLGEILFGGMVLE